MLHILILRYLLYLSLLMHLCIYFLNFSFIIFAYDSSNIDLFTILEILIVVLLIQDYNSFLFDYFCAILFLTKIITVAYSSIYILYNFFI